MRAKRRYRVTPTQRLLHCPVELRGAADKRTDTVAVCGELEHCRYERPSTSSSKCGTYLTSLILGPAITHPRENLKNRSDLKHPAPVSDLDTVSVTFLGFPLLRFSLLRTIEGKQDANVVRVVCAQRTKNCWQSRDVVYNLTGLDCVHHPHRSSFDTSSLRCRLVRNEV